MSALRNMQLLLAIAKPAMQIQSTKTSLYNSVFVMFGPLHIEIVYFGSLSYLPDVSGGLNIMINTEVLAAGSPGGFILEKHYNR